MSDEIIISIPGVGQWAIPARRVDGEQQNAGQSLGVLHLTPSGQLQLTPAGDAPVHLDTSRIASDPPPSTPAERERQGVQVTSAAPTAAGAPAPPRSAPLPPGRRPEPPRLNTGELEFEEALPRRPATGASQEFEDTI